MKYTISIEGQSIEMSEDIASDDGKLKAALSPFFPGAANAKFMRSEPKDETITVTVIKQAGTKGSEPEDQVLRRLIEAREGQNPVIAMQSTIGQTTLNQMPVEKMLEIDSQIEATINLGTRQYENLKTTQRLLIEAEPKPAPCLVPGF